MVLNNRRGVEEERSGSHHGVSFSTVCFKRGRVLRNSPQLHDVVNEVAPDLENRSLSSK